VNQEQTVLIAQESFTAKKLLVKLSNNKELKAYSEALKKPHLAALTIPNIKP